MDWRGRQLVLWGQAIVLGAAGLALLLLPAEAEQAWPWALPPLAARITGAGFLGIAAAAARVAAWREPGGLRALAAMGVGTLLVPLTGFITGGVDRYLPLLLAITVLFGALAVANLAMARNAPARGSWGPMTRPYATYFALHLALVIPVGIALYVAPDAMADFAPWPLSPVNVRLLSGIVLASAPLSVMALLDRDWAAVYPIAASHAVFVTLATAAMVIHFDLFDPARIRTWFFLALYVAAAIASTMAFVRATQARASSGGGRTAAR